jgi:hypothetical protein
MGLARDKGLIGPVVVPQEYRALIRDAAQTCPKIPVEIFAAQIAAESTWDPRASSGAGAQGIAQFMPAVWEQYGLDANEDGERSDWLTAKFGDAAVDRVDESAPPFGRSKSSTESRMVRCEKYNDKSDKRDKSDSESKQCCATEFSKPWINHQAKECDEWQH